MNYWELGGILLITGLLGVGTLLAWIAPDRIRDFQMKSMNKLPNWWPLRNFNRSFYATDASIWLQRALLSIAFIVAVKTLLNVISRFDF